MRFNEQRSTWCLKVVSHFGSHDDRFWISDKSYKPSFETVTLAKLSLFFFLPYFFPLSDLDSSQCSLSIPICWCTWAYPAEQNLYILARVGPKATLTEKKRTLNTRPRSSRGGNRTQKTEQHVSSRTEHSAKCGGIYKRHQGLVHRQSRSVDIRHLRLEHRRRQQGPNRLSGRQQRPGETHTNTRELKKTPHTHSLLLTLILIFQKKRNMSSKRARPRSKSRRVPSCLRCVIRRKWSTQTIWQTSAISTSLLVNS